MSVRHRAPVCASIAAAAALVLAACGQDEADQGGPEQDSPAADTVTITDAWVISGEEGMTSAYGELSNPSETEVTIDSASTTAAESIELHETVENESGEMVMREVEGGFVIPAEGSLTLEPGGDHLMLMGLTEPLLAGEEATFVLEFDDGSTLEFAASVRDYAGGNESYEDGDDHGGHEGHGDDHDEHGHDEPGHGEH